MTNPDLPDMEILTPDHAGTAATEDTVSSPVSSVPLLHDRESYEALKTDLLAPVEVGAGTGALDASGFDADDDTVLRDEFGDPSAFADDTDSFPHADLPDESDDSHDADTLPPEHPADSLVDDAPASPDELHQQRRTAQEALEARRAHLLEMESLLRYEDRPTLVREIAGLEEQLRTLEHQTGQADAHAATLARESSRQYQSNVSQVLHQYPDSGVPGTPFYQRMVELDRQLRTSADPAHRSVDKPLRLAAMVAREMEDMAVLTQAQASGHGIPAPVFLPQVASGAARTSSTPQGAAESAIASVNTPDQLDALKRHYFGRTAL